MLIPIYNYIQKRTGLATIALLLGIFGYGCSKDDDPVAPEKTDRNRIGYILEDNFNFTFCHSLLKLTGQDPALKQDTSYTFLAPDNTAFNLLRINQIPFYEYTGNWYAEIARNAMLPGTHRFRDLPLGDNQSVPAVNGHHVYVSRYLLNNDTITTVNGVNVQEADVKASNGVLQIMSQVVQPERVKNVAEYLLSDTTVTLFALAIQHSGLLPLLQSNEYTLLAPINQVMRSNGAIRPGLNLTSTENILASDPQELASLLKYHIVPGRNFLDRIHRTAESSGASSISTLHGEKILIGGNSETYNGTTFQGKSNNSQAGIYKYYSAGYNTANFPAGNGVVHIINQILIP